jgi:hypothetical protein
MQQDIKTLLQNDKYHQQFVSKSKKLGMMQLLAFDNCYLFIDITGKFAKIKPEEVTKFTILSSKDFHAIYLPLNKPKELFSAEGVFIGDKEAYTERQQMYGIYHDVFNTALTENRTNSIWSGSFCRAIARISTEYNFSVEILKRWGSLTEARKDYDNFESLFNHYYHGDNSFLNSKFKETGLLSNEVSLTEEKIISTLKKVKQLPSQYQKEILKNYKKIKELKYFLDEKVN